MDLYARTSYATARLFTRQYSTSFSSASRLFDASVRDDIYAIYGLVRVADEIVDTYRGADAGQLLKQLEADTDAAIKSGYSTNPLVHAFALTARRYTIGAGLTRPFFASMALDLAPQHYDQTLLDTYIYGSAEVVGLMCLRVFCKGDQVLYDKLTPGARRLGAAYQKINFLRDLGHDISQLGRDYFAVGTLPLSEADKQRIIANTKADFSAAKNYISQLPANAQAAVTVSYRYYYELLRIIERTPATTLGTTRLRVSDHRKARLLAGAVVSRLARGRRG